MTTVTHLPARDILHDLLLPRQRRPRPPIRIPILLCEDQGHQVDPGPSELASEFPAGPPSTRFLRRPLGRRGLPSLEVALAETPEAKGADGADDAEEGCAAGTAEGEVALVLDWTVSAGWRHVPIEKCHSSALRRGAAGKSYVLLEAVRRHVGGHVVRGGGEVMR